MKLFQFYEDGAVRLGAEADGRRWNLRAVGKKLGISLPNTMEEAIATPDVLAAISNACSRAALSGTDLEESELRESVSFAPVVSRPEKILCVGLNYRSHTQETNETPPAFPLLFGKFPNALTGHGQTLRLPQAASRFDYEAELVLVIGKRASCVSPEEAAGCLFGCTCGNDFSARDAQFRSSQWLIGKSFDGFAPIGPYLTPAGQLNPERLDISSSVNGQVRQHSSTAQMIFDWRQIISYASQYMTLLPGDLIFTGTPGGVILGYPEEKQVWLKAGDQVSVTIEGIGTLTNRLA